MRSACQLRCQSTPAPLSRADAAARRPLRAARALRGPAAAARARCESHIQPHYVLASPFAGVRPPRGDDVHLYHHTYGSLVRVLSGVAQDAKPQTTDYARRGPPTPCVEWQNVRLRRCRRSCQGDVYVCGLSGEFAIQSSRRRRWRGARRRGFGWIIRVAWLRGGSYRRGGTFTVEAAPSADAPSAPPDLATPRWWTRGARP